MAAQEERIDAELGLGRHATLVGELEQLVATHPRRERLLGQLMLALYRCGRQAEALEVYRAARLALADELGLDPSPELQELERRILNQDPELDAPSEVTADSPTREVSELRLVTVLAATPPAADDPERLHRLLDETLASVRDVLDRYGGSLQRFGPEGLVAVFGADGPADDDAERAVLAARELGLSAGVATGEVVQGAGAVVTRAVELARVGGIRLDERTAALVRAERRLDAPLAGRTEELAHLRAALAPRARKALPRRHRHRRAGDRQDPARPRAGAARGSGDDSARRPLHRPRPGRHLPATARGASPGRARSRRSPASRTPNSCSTGWPRSPKGRRRRRSASRTGPSAGCSRRSRGTRPVLLVLDDVHWAEPALVDLVDYLADRADAPLLVLCLARPELDTTARRRRSRSAPLGEEEARAIVAGTAVVDEETRERIVELAEGNALYAEQLASFAADGGEGLPPTLEAVLAGRLGRLDPAERSVLQRAAVVGREFSLGAVAALADGEVAPELLSLSRAGFVHPAAAADPGDDGYTFHHVLLRDAAYGSLTKADRADLHERAAAWIDRDGPGDDAIAGYHLEQAVRYRRELGEDADELAATAGERLGEAGMRVWRTNDVGACGRAAPTSDGAVACRRASCRAALCGSTRWRSRFRGSRHGRSERGVGERARDDGRTAPVKPDRSRGCWWRTRTRALLELDLPLDRDARGVPRRPSESAPQETYAVSARAELSSPTCTGSRAATTTLAGRSGARGASTTPSRDSRPRYRSRSRQKPSTTVRYPFATAASHLRGAARVGRG